jgi:hypothetical protein
VYFGGDSAATGGDAIEIRRDSKVFIRDQVLFGFQNSFRVGQLLRYSLVVPKRRRGMDLNQYMCTTFVDAVYECMKAGRALGNDEEDEDAPAVLNSSQFLVGYGGRIFRIDGDFAVAEVGTLWDAIGSGGDSARGALLAQDLVIATAKRNKRAFTYTPEQRILDALTASERLTPNVRRPFSIIKSPEK